MTGTASIPARVIPPQDIPVPLLVAAGAGRITVKRQGVVENAWLFTDTRPAAPVYRPAVWCTNQGCHTPYASDLAACPECGTATLMPGEYGDPGEGRH